jgi:hypothetical protein
MTEPGRDEFLALFRSNMATPRWFAVLGGIFGEGIDLSVNVDGAVIVAWDCRSLVSNAI